MVNLFSRLFGKGQSRKFSKDICASSENLARGLVSELSKVPYKEIQLKKLYATDVFGALCFLSAFKKEDRWSVEVYGYYEGIEDWVFEDDAIKEFPSYTPHFAY